MEKFLAQQQKLVTRTINWPRKVNPDRRELLLPNHKAPRAPERPGLWPIRRRSAESEGTATRDKMFDFHPSSQTILSILAGLIATCPLTETLTSAHSQWIPSSSAPEGFTFLCNLLLKEKARLRCREAKYCSKTKGGLRGLKETSRRQLRLKCYLTESQGSWRRWQEVYREWWDRLPTRTTRGEDTLWKVRLRPPPVAPHKRKKMQLLTKCAKVDMLELRKAFKPAKNVIVNDSFNLVAEAWVFNVLLRKILVKLSRVKPAIPAATRRAFLILMLFI